ILKKNIVTSIVGSSSSGKTTIGKLCVSIFSSPRDGLLVKDFTSTENHILQKMNHLNGTAVMINASPLRHSIKFDQFLYKLANGQENGRLKKGNVASEIVEWHSSIFIPAENSLLLNGNTDFEGKAAQVIEIPVSEDDLFDSFAQEEEISKLFNSNYGVIEPAFVQYLIKNRLVDKLEELYESELKETRKLIHDDENLLNRIAQSISIACMTGKLAAECLGIDFQIVYVRSYLVENCREHIEEMRELNEKATDVSMIYRFLMSILKNKIEDRKEDYCIVKSADFKVAAKAVIEEFGINNSSELKELLKQGGYLVVNSGNFGYRKEAYRGYALKEKVSK
ncbi:MAG: DUF927 domain-containing protein, partial [Clostridia bacterium]